MHRNPICAGGRGAKARVSSQSLLRLDLVGYLPPGSLSLFGSSSSSCVVHSGFADGMIGGLLPVTFTICRCRTATIRVIRERMRNATRSVGVSIVVAEIRQDTRDSSPSPAGAWYHGIGCAVWKEGTLLYIKFFTLEENMSYPGSFFLV